MITQKDISTILKAHGKPGQNRNKKIQAIVKLFESKHEPTTNFQGIDILEDLQSYREF